MGQGADLRRLMNTQEVGRLARGLIVAPLHPLKIPCIAVSISGVTSKSIRHLIIRTSIRPLLAHRDVCALGSAVVEKAAAPPPPHGPL